MEEYQYNIITTQPKLSCMLIC